MPQPPLSRHAIDRDHRSRVEPGAIERALGERTTRILLVDGDRALIAHDTLVRVTADAVPEGARYSWMGRGTSGIVLSALVAPGTPAPEGAHWAELRDIGAALDAEDAGLMTQAIALAHWQRSVLDAPPGGGTPIFEEAGWVARDASGAAHFPRTDPAVIVAIHDAADERILLGRNAAWPADRYSLIAGFVDPGESLESAVVREVREETGLDVVDARYVSSQPWPFPRSLMLGFECVAPEPEPTQPDGVEILDVRWLTRDELRAGVVALPGGASIAAFLIERWIARG